MRVSESVVHAIFKRLYISRVPWRTVVIRVSEPGFRDVDYLFDVVVFVWLLCS